MHCITIIFYYKMKVKNICLCLLILFEHRKECGVLSGELNVLGLHCGPLVDVSHQEELLYGRHQGEVSE